jgi:CPA2 family monovalent cation:H+ antiporter-2
MHGDALITTVVVGFVLAFVFGAIANRLRLPPLAGYLVAGVVVGPHTPGFVADVELATQLSEIGVVLLMFGVGLHFSLRDLVSVQTVAVPGALIRIVVATLLGMGLGVLHGWSLPGSFIFGLALSVASTVVLIKGLQDRHLVESDRGRIATGWVIVEDIAMVLALVLIPSITGLLGVSASLPDDPFVNLVERLTGIELGLIGTLAVTIIKLAAFVGFMLIVGRRLIPMLLHYTAHTGSRELFRLAVLAISLGVAAGAAYLFGVSLALGAFFAGMVLSESELSHRAAEESLPLRDAFAVLFFVSVGMLFDVSIIWRDPLPLLGTLAIVTVGRIAIAHFTLVLFRQPPASSLWISASLAQIGEFSFILATLGLSLGVLPPEGRDLIVAGAIVSILLNPLIVWAADRLRPRLEQRVVREPEIATDGRVEPVVAGAAPAIPVPPVVEEEEVEHPTALTGHTVLIGYGRVGTTVADGLAAANRSFLIVEDAERRIGAARTAGFEVITGNAAASKPLRLANVEGANTIIVAIPNAFEAGQAVEQCRRANPQALIIARAHSDEESNYLLGLGANTTIIGEREIGMAMLDLINPSTIAKNVGLGAVEAALSSTAAPVVPAQAAGPTPIDEEALARAIGAPIPPLLPPELMPPAAQIDPPPPAPPAASPRRPSTTPGTPFGGRTAPSPGGGAKPAGLKSDAGKTPEKQS